MSVTRTGEQGDVIVLRAGSSAYVFALRSPHPAEPAQPPVQHVWWGTDIDDADAVRLAARARGVRRASGNIPDPAPHDEELPIEGGRRQGDVALAIEPLGAATGLRGLAIAAVDARIDGERVLVDLTDPAAGVVVSLGYEAIPAHGIIRRWTTVACREGAGAVLAPPASAHVPIPRSLVGADAAPGWDGPTQRLRATLATGDYGTETCTTTTVLTPGAHVWTARSGTPGHQQQPFLAIHAGASESCGRVHSVQLAWNGSHRLAARAHQDGATEVTVGIDPDRAPVRLEPGGSFTTPSAYLHVTDGGLGAMSRAWHAFERDAVSPRGREVRPVLVNSWESTGMDVDLDGQKRLADVAADLGAEMLVVDDGWFANRDSEADGLGDWEADPRAFPGGLGELADHVHGLGMLFGLWIEPESASPSSRVVAEHPDWVLRWPGREPELVRGQVTLDLSRADVRDHLVAVIDGLVRDCGIDMLKWDLNRPLVEPFAADPSTGSTPMIAQARGVREVWERLRAAHPDLLLETCQSGGGRADLDSLSLADWAWTSDDTDALERLAIQDGYSLVHGAHTMACWVTDCPNGLTGRTLPLEFRFHVAMCGVLGLGGDLPAWSDEERALARRLVGAYRRHRATIQLGDLHRTFRRTGSGDLIQRGYRADDGQEIVVLTFAPSVRLLEHTQVVGLGALVDPAARYRVERILATGPAERDDLGVMGGAALAGQGLPLALSGDAASAMHVLTRLPEVSPRSRTGR